MAISVSSLKTAKGENVKVRPPIFGIYGVPGIGKTTIAAGAPNPVIMFIEDGQGQLDVPSWSPEEMCDFDAVMAGIGSLYTDKHDRQTLIIDTIDWLEKHVQKETCKRNGWANLETPGYGKGYLAADEVWREVLDGLKALRNDRDMMIILLSHFEIKRFNNPDTEPYDRYKIKLQARAEALITEACDIIGFLNYRISIQKADAGFNKKVARATGGGQRLLFLQERPSAHAKNRFGMPSEIELPEIDKAYNRPEEIWAAIQAHLPAMREEMTGE